VNHAKRDIYKKVSWVTSNIAKVEGGTGGELFWVQSSPQEMSLVSENTGEVSSVRTSEGGKNMKKATKKKNGPSSNHRKTDRGGNLSCIGTNQEGQLISGKIVEVLEGSPRPDQAPARGCGRRDFGSTLYQVRGGSFVVGPSLWVSPQRAGKSGSFILWRSLLKHQEEKVLKDFYLFLDRPHVGNA